MSSSSSSSFSPLSAPLLPVPEEDSDGHHHGGEKTRGTYTARAAALVSAGFCVSALSFLAGRNLSDGRGGNYHRHPLAALKKKINLVSLRSNSMVTAASTGLSPAEAERLFDEANTRLVSSPPRGARDDDNEAEEEEYALSDVVLSSALADEYHALHPNMLYRSWEKASEAREACKEGRDGSGSEERRWPCLEPNEDSEEVKTNEDKDNKKNVIKKTNEDNEEVKKNVVEHIYGEHPLPKHQSHPSEHTVAALRNLIRAESVGSIAEFGAGAGQLKAAVLNGAPSLTDDLTEYLDHAKAASALGLGGEDVPEPLRYDAYDMAGNVASWTGDFVAHFDPNSGPLSLPKADWVVSLGYGSAGNGERPSSGGEEGMLLRNLHRHNCRGIILDHRSAAKLTVGSREHRHARDVFEGLGYEYDAEASALLNGEDAFEVGVEGGAPVAAVYRRREPVC